MFGHKRVILFFQCVLIRCFRREVGSFGVALQLSIEINNNALSGLRVGISRLGESCDEPQIVKHNNLFPVTRQQTLKLLTRKVSNDC